MTSRGAEARAGVGAVDSENGLCGLVFLELLFLPGVRRSPAAARPAQGARAAEPWRYQEGALNRLPHLPKRGVDIGSQAPLHRVAGPSA